MITGILWNNFGVADIREIESKKITSHKDKVVTTVCIDGYKFVIAENQNGISITQALYRGGGNKPQPEKC